MAPAEIETRIFGLPVTRKEVRAGHDVEVQRIERSTSIEVITVNAVSDTEADVNTQREWVGFGFKRPFATYKDLTTVPVSIGSEVKIKTRVPGITKIVRIK